MHGCGDYNQLVFERAIHDWIRASLVGLCCFYESTKHAIRYHSNTESRIPFDTIVNFYNIYFMAGSYMAATSSQNDDGATDMESVLECDIFYVCK